MVSWAKLYELAQKTGAEEIVAACGPEAFAILAKDLAAMRHGPPIPPAGAGAMSADGGRLVVVLNEDMPPDEYWVSARENVIETIRFVPVTRLVERATYAPFDKSKVVRDVPALELTPTN